MPTVGGLVIEVAANVARLQKDVDSIRGHFGRLHATQKEYAKTSQGIFEQLKVGWVGIASKIYLVEQSLHFIGKAFAVTFGKGIQAVESYKQGVVTASAVTLQVMDTSQYKDIGEAWKTAKEYAEGMVPVLEEVAEKTMLTGDQTQMLFTQFAKNGVLLDATNEKAIRGFESMANAIAIMTKGQGVEKQVMSEINALMEGQARQGATIYDMLEKQIPNLKEQMEIWKKQGTVFENLLPYLKGFDAASGEIRLTWEATKTTLETTLNKILREGMADAFEKIVDLAQKLNDWAKSHQQELKEIARIYSEVIIKAIEKTAKAVWNIAENLKPIFESFTSRGKALQELGNIELRIKGIKEKLETGPNFIESLFGQNKESYKKEIQQLESRAEEIKKKFLAHTEPSKEFALKIKPPDVAQIKDYADILEKLNEKIEIINLSSFDKQRKELEKEITDLRQKLGDEPLIQEYFDLKMAKIQFQELEKIFEKTKQQTIKILEADEKATKKRLEYLNQYRESLLSTYDYAISKAQEYYKTSADLEEKIAHGKAFMAGFGGEPDDIESQMAKEKKAIAEMVRGEGINIFDTKNTFKTMETIEKFLDKYKGIQDDLGFDISFSGIKKDYDDLINKLEVTRNSTEQAGDAWTEYANEQAIAIQTVDQWIQYLQAKIAEMDAQIATVREIQIDTSSALGNVENLIAQIQFLNAISGSVGAVASVSNPNAGGGFNFDTGPVTMGEYATGTNYVPRTGVYKLHQGEAVIPANQNNQTNNFNPTIIVQGSNGQSIAKEIDKELAQMWQYNRSALRKAMA